MRVVLDTVVFVRALINPYSWWGRLIFDHADRYQLIVSPAIVEEYLAVLRRPELTRKYRSVATRDLHAVLDLMSSDIVVQPQEVPSVSRDPADDKFLAAAHAGGTDVIVTADADLLDLGHHEQIAMPRHSCKPWSSPTETVDGRHDAGHQSVTILGVVDDGCAYFRPLREMPSITCFWKRIRNGIVAILPAGRASIL